jgi:outer membrane protein assembly factor BamB
MAFALRNLSVLAYANGFTLWHYKSANDNQKIVGLPGYFGEAGDMLSAGDIVIISAPEGGQVLCVVPDGNALRTAKLA